MAYRFTNTDKWSDSWFSGLKQIEMLLFMYLCDNCDIAGFAEVNYKRWAVDLNSNISTIEGALKGLQRGILISTDGECIYLKNFLRHQKNLPLNPNNRVCTGILKRFELYRYKFNIQDINKFIESPINGASMGHQCPTGIGIGIGIEEKGGMGEKEDLSEEPKQKRFNFRKAMTNYGFDEGLVDEWIKVRKAKKATNTERAFENFISEVEKTGMDKNQLLEIIAVKKQWRGFDAEWVGQFLEKKLTYEEVSILVTQGKASFEDFTKKEIDGVIYWIPKK